MLTIVRRVCRGLRAFLSKELPQEHVAFIGFAAGGWVDMLRWTGVCVKPAPPTQQDYGDDALEPLKLCKRGITSSHAHDCQEGGGLRASLSKELPQEDVAFIGFAAGGWVDIKLVVNLGCVWTAVCVKPAPLTQEDCGDDALWWTQ